MWDVSSRPHPANSTENCRCYRNRGWNRCDALAVDRSPRRVRVLCGSRWRQGFVRMREPLRETRAIQIRQPGRRRKEGSLFCFEQGSLLGTSDNPVTTWDKIDCSSPAHNYCRARFLSIRSSKPGKKRFRYTAATSRPPM